MKATFLSASLDGKERERRRLLRRAAALGFAALYALSSDVARAQTNDPAGSSVLVGALTWLQGTLLGTLATTAAVIAVAAVGFLMLTGRLDWRRGITVVVGCFVVFGAGVIVAGIRQAAG
jgi:type IV secretory pathway VirB2 component (pilin)